MTNHMQFYSFSRKNLRKEIAKNRRSKAFVLLKISGVEVFYCDVIQVKNTISKLAIMQIFKVLTLSVSEFFNWGSCQHDVILGSKYC